MTPPPESSEPARHDPYAALRVSNYRRFFVGHVLSVFGFQMQSVAVGWELYARTGSKLDLGLVGLIQFLPVLLFALPAGYLADHFHRKKIVLGAVAVLACGSAMLAVASWSGQNIWITYVCLLVNGIARAVQQPAKASLVPLIVPREQYTNAVTWNSTGFQLACILGVWAEAGYILAPRGVHHTGWYIAAVVC